MILSPLLLTVFRVFLGMIFLISSLIKMRDPISFRNNISAYQLISRRWTNFIAYGLIIVEVVLSILLLIGWQSQIVAAFTAILLVIFIVAMGITIRKGKKNLDCGCFGTKYPQKISFKLIFRNFVFLILALVISFYGGGFLTIDHRFLVVNKEWLSIRIITPYFLIGVGIFIVNQLIRQLYKLVLCYKED